MPELSRFYGIVIALFYKDHGTPHIHAYGGNRRRPDWTVKLAIGDGHLIDGFAPPAALKLVRQWMTNHEPELLEAWRTANSGHRPARIAPLRLR